MPYVMVNAGSNPTREKHSFQNDFKISDSVKNFFRRSPVDRADSKNSSHSIVNGQSVCDASSRTVVFYEMMLLFWSSYTSWRLFVMLLSAATFPYFTSYTRNRESSYSLC